MTTTLVTQVRARAGQAPALPAAAVGHFRAADGWSPARLRLRLFQGREQPDLLLIVSDWTSRVAARRYLEAGPIRPELEGLALGAVEHGFYHELTTYEPLTAPVALARCTRLSCARTAMSRLLSYMLEVTGPALRAQPGLLLHT